MALTTTFLIMQIIAIHSPRNNFSFNNSDHFYLKILFLYVRSFSLFLFLTCVHPPRVSFYTSLTFYALKFTNVLFLKTYSLQILFKFNLETKV